MALRGQLPPPPPAPATGRPPTTAGAAPPGRGQRQVRLVCLKLLPIITYKSDTERAPSAPCHDAYVFKKCVTFSAGAI